jgi:hypothetical protein
MSDSNSGHSNGLGGFGCSVSSTSDASPKSPIPAQQPSLSAFALQTCSNSCAHVSALTPSGTFGPGKRIEDVTYDQLEKYNLVVLMILAAEMDAQFHRIGKSASGHNMRPEDSLKCSITEFSHDSSSQPDHRSEGKDNKWTRTEFECLQKILLYRNAASYESKGPAVVWLLYDTNTAWDSQVKKKKKINIRQSWFIQKLLDIPDAALDPLQSPNSDVLTSPTVDNLITRRHSTPDLRVRARTIAPSITQSIGLRARPLTAELLHGTPFSHQPNRIPTRGLPKPMQKQVSKAALPSDSSRLADLVYSGLAKRGSDDLVQTISSVIGTVAGVVGSVGSVAAVYLLWKQNRQRRGSTVQSDEIELAALTSQGDGCDTVGECSVADGGESTGGNASIILPTTHGYPTHNHAGNGRYPTEEMQSSANDGGASDGSAPRSTCYCRQEERTHRDHLQGDYSLQSWVNTSFFALYDIIEDSLVCKHIFLEHIRRKYVEVQSRNAGIFAQLETQSTLRANAEKQRAEWETKARIAEAERDEWEKQAGFAKAERDRWEKQAGAAKAEKDELLSHIATDPVASERLQKMRLKLVFRDLVITVWKKRLNEWVQKEQFKLVSKDKELNRAEAKRQEHNRKTQELFQKESLQTRQHLETEIRKLQSARTILVTDQAVLAQSQQAYTTKNAALHREINTLETAVHAQEASFARQRNAVESATKELAARERASKSAEVRANERMLQRRLELVRKEDALAEREKAMRRG